MIGGRRKAPAVLQRRRPRRVRALDKRRRALPDERRALAKGRWGLRVAAGEPVDAYGVRPRPKGARHDVVVVELRSEVPVVLSSELSVNAERTLNQRLVVSKHPAVPISEDRPRPSHVELEHVHLIARRPFPELWTHVARSPALKSKGRKNSKRQSPPTLSSDAVGNLTGAMARRRRVSSVLERPARL